MFSKELKVNCIKGEDIHWATRLVQISNEYSSSLRIKHKEHNMNAKSLLGVLSLKLSKGKQKACKIKWSWRSFISSSNDGKLFCERKEI